MKFQFIAITLVSITSNFAYGIGLSEAARRSCVAQLCGAECQDNQIKYAAAERQCAQYDIDLTISCPTAENLTLKSSLKALNTLSGNDGVDNPVDCSYDLTSNRGERYSCESIQGSTYARIELSVDQRKIKPSSFELTIRGLKNTDNEGIFDPVFINGFHRCTAELDMH
jgi:hypothetical protein